MVARDHLPQRVSLVVQLADLCHQPNVARPHIKPEIVAWIGVIGERHCVVVDRSPVLVELSEPESSPGLELEAEIGLDHAAHDCEVLPARPVRVVRHARFDGGATDGHDRPEHALQQHVEVRIDAAAAGRVHQVAPVTGGCLETAAHAHRIAIGRVQFPVLGQQRPHQHAVRARHRVGAFQGRDEVGAPEGTVHRGGVHDRAAGDQELHQRQPRVVERNVGRPLSAQRGRKDGQEY